MAYVLALVSGLAFAFAAYLALDMIRERRATKARIARAVRPVYGESVLWDAPVRSFDRPGEN